jgi:plastocyanin
MPSYRGLLVATALASVLVLLVLAVALRDREAAAIGVGLLVGVVLLRWWNGIVGRILLGLLFVDIFGWMVLAAVSNITHREDFLDVAIPVGLVVLSVVGVVAAVLSGPRREGTPGSRNLAIGAVAVFVIAAAGSRVPGVGTSQEARPGDITVEMRDLQFSDDDLDATVGELGVVVTNHDLFWHTFTIDELDVDVRVPVGGTRRTSFAVSQGTYRFVCTIPGHESAGMEGTLVVR